MPVFRERIVASRARLYTPCICLLGNVPQTPTEHTIKLCGCAPFGSLKIRGKITVVPVIFLSLFQIECPVKAGQHLLLQSR